MKTRRFVFLFMAAVVALWTGGCSTPETRIRRDPETFSRLTAEQQAMIRSGQIALDFPPEMVRLALGDPDHTSIRTDKNGTSEIWSYVSYDCPDEIGFYYGWYRRPVYWGRGGPFYSYSYPYFDGPGYRRERVILQVTIREGKAVSVEQAKE